MHTDVVTRTLKQNIAAIPIREEPEPESGAFMQLPAGSKIEVHGDGFNDKTVKVRCRRELYFVFRYDVDNCR